MRFKDAIVEFQDYFLNLIFILLSIVAIDYVYISLVKKFKFNFYTKNDIFFTLFNLKDTFAIVSIIFTLITVIFLVWSLFLHKDYLKNQDNRKEKNYRPFFLGFMLLFVASLIDSLLVVQPKPSPVILYGRIGYSFLIEEIILLITLISTILYLISLPVLFENNNSGFINIIKNGTIIQYRYYIYTMFIGLFGAVLFYFLGYSLLIEIPVYTIIFSSIIGLSQRYGVLAGFSMIFVFFGIELGEISFIPLSQYLFDLILYISIILGLVEGYASPYILNTNKRRNYGTEEIDNLGKKENKKPENEEMQNNNTPEMFYNQKKDNTPNSRKYSSILWVRGGCPNCEGREFIYKNGEYECKNCKTMIEGDETDYREFFILVRKE